MIFWKAVNYIFNKYLMNYHFNVLEPAASPVIGAPWYTRM